MKDIFNNLKINGEWTRDCGGKQSYDPNLLAVSTRYWTDNTAHSSIILMGGEDYQNITLIEKNFEASSETAVKFQVEEWAQTQFDVIQKILIKHFKG